MHPFRNAAVVAALFTTALPAFAQSADFALKSGDRVVFYGDSITDQRMYTLFVEQFVATRFPKRDIKFVHSGWGGDRVGGGGGGPIDLRLDRDVTAYKPTVVTVMLGMNDASYRPFDQGIFDTYANGYRHLVDKLQNDNPGVRLTLIQPSPYDDVTRPPGFTGGYNAVLLRYGQYVGQLAREKGARVADLNTYLTQATQKAFAANPTVAARINPDRVHPDWGGHLLMAASLLKAWNAPSLVSSVTVNALAGTTSAEGAKTSSVSKDTSTGALTWTVTEEALPFPIVSPNGDPNSTAAFQLAVASCDIVDTLNREMLTVTNLASGRYTLAIDGKEIGVFERDQLTAGINLATLPTPMLRQAQLVAQLSRLRANLHNSRWREIQVPQAADPSLPSILKTMDAATDNLARARHDAAQPRPHTFTLTPK